MINSVAPLLALATIVLPGPIQQIPEGEAEIGGRLVHFFGGPFTSRASVRFYTDDLCLTSVETDDEGTFTARLPAGSYLAVATLLGLELGRERIVVGPGSWQHDIKIHAPLIEMPEISISARSPPADSRSG
jgi:hypothetical protein